MGLIMYLCAFISKIYLEEAKVCIQSIRKNGLFEGVIYLFTDLDIDKDIDIRNDCNIKVIKTKCPSIELSASYRTRLFEHLPLSQFTETDIILYIDTDVVIMKPLSLLDLNNIGNKINVYGYPKRTQTEGSFSGFLTKDITYTNTMAFCSGILLFHPTLEVKKVFDEIYELYLSLIKQRKINACWEQPALCYKFIEHDIYEISLNNVVYEERSNSNIKPTDNYIFNHFCGMRSSNRVNLMKKYINK